MDYDWEKLRVIYELKQVYRMAPVGERKESSAEHSWSCLVLADYFLGVVNDDSIDRLRVYELLMYHDLVEIIVGDTPVYQEEKRKEKEEKERQAVKDLVQRLPGSMRRIESLFEEYCLGETKEAQFAKIIDKFDALLHELDYKVDWKGWSEERVRKYHGKPVKNIPELEKVFDEILEYARENGYFDQ